MISIITLTWERAECVERCIRPSLDNLDYPYEFLTCDNGSKDPAVVEAISKLKPAYQRVNKENLGIASMQNELMHKAKGDYLCVMDNDLIMPKGWGSALVEANQKVDTSGISSLPMDDTFVGSTAVIQGIKIMYTTTPVGARFFNRMVFETLGYLDTQYSPYGYEDPDYCYRSQIIGFNNYVLQNGMHQVHVGGDYDTPAIAKWKADSVAKLTRQFWSNIDEYRRKRKVWFGYTPSETADDFTVIAHT